jgi:hypothetical protein
MISEQYFTIFMRWTRKTPITAKINRLQQLYVSLSLQTPAHHFSFSSRSSSVYQSFVNGSAQTHWQCCQHSTLYHIAPVIDTFGQSN